MWLQPVSPDDHASHQVGPRLELVRKFPGRGAFVRRLNDGRLLFRGKRWYFWDPRTGVVDAAPGPNVALRYAEDGSPDGRRLAYMIEGGVLLYDFSRGDSLGRYDCEPDERSLCRFSPDGKFLWFSFGDRIGVVVMDTEEVHVEPTGCGPVDLLHPHGSNSTALLTLSRGPHPTAIATFNGVELRITPSEREGTSASFSPLGRECALANDEGGYGFVDFPDGFGEAVPSVRETPASFERDRQHSVAYLTERLLLELQTDLDQLFLRRESAMPPRVTVLDRASLARTAVVRFTKSSVALIAAMGDPHSSTETCAIDSVDTLGDGLVLTYDHCCGHRVWDARALCSIDA
jgi:hypothetical protein